MTPSITVKQARKILKNDAVELSDEQVLAIIDHIALLADAAIKLVPKSSQPGCEERVSGGK